jgi:hypothetical protein
MRKLIGRALLVAAMGWSSALAHEGGLHARGVVKEASKERIVLTTTAGKLFTAAMSRGTRVVRSGQVVGVEEIRVGDRAVVHARQDGERLEATEVKLGPGK